MEEETESDDGEWMSVNNIEEVLLVNKTLQSEMALVRTGKAKTYSHKEVMKKLGL